MVPALSLRAPAAVARGDRPRRAARGRQRRLVRIADVGRAVESVDGEMTPGRDRVRRVGDDAATERNRGDERQQQNFPPHSPDLRPSLAGRS